MTNYGVGDKVVCVDDKFPPDIGKLYDALPVKDTVYVVRDVPTTVILGFSDKNASLRSTG